MDGQQGLMSEDVVGQMRLSVAVVGVRWSKAILENVTEDYSMPLSDTAKVLLSNARGVLHDLSMELDRLLDEGRLMWP